MAHSNSRNYFVYILASQAGGTLYIGVTNDLLRRVREHKDGAGGEFTKKHAVHRLVYYEGTTDIESAIMREKQLKKWNREWKVDLIRSLNPTWKDLYEEILVG